MSKETKLRIIPLGGMDGIGKNMTVVEYGNDMVVIDAGLMFPDEETPGVDLLLPDYTYVLENEHKLRGILLTHGHEDHIGALPYVLKDLQKQVPIFGTKLTLGLVEYKAKEHRLENVKYREIVPGEYVNVGIFGCDFFSVNHSIPGSVGIFLRTPGGNVLFTGDFKLDQTPIDGVRTDFAALSRFAKTGVDVLISDSTNATVSRFTPSEAEVGHTLDSIIGQAKGRVVVASFASHIHRLQQVCNSAIRANRKVVVTGRSMIANTKIARDLGYLNVPDDLLIDAYELDKLPAEKVVVLCTGSQGEPLSALARIVSGDHKTIEIEEGDTVIISASPVPGNEKAVSRIKNSLAKLGADTFDKERALVHVSGHGGAEELKLMLSIVNPTYFIPAHGEAMHLRAHAELAEAVGVKRENIFILDNGDVVEIGKNGAAFGTPVENGIVFVDGLSVGDVSQVVLRDRKVLSKDGVVTVIIPVDHKAGKLAGEVQLVMRGVADDEDGALLADTLEYLNEVLKTSSPHNHSDPSMRVKKTCRDAISRYLWQNCRTRPMVIPIIVEV